MGIRIELNQVMAPPSYVLDGFSLWRGFPRFERGNREIRKKKHLYGTIYITYKHTLELFAK